MPIRDMRFLLKAYKPGSIDLLNQDMLPHQDNKMYLIKVLTPVNPRPYLKTCTRDAQKVASQEGKEEAEIEKGLT